jgi:hypothetical protein
MVAAFAIKLLAGITLMWLLMPRREVTDGFFRIQMLVVLGLAVLTTLAIEPSASGLHDPMSVAAVHPAASGADVAWLRGLGIATCLAAYAGHVFWKLGRRVPGSIAIYTVGLTTAGMLLLHAVWAVSKAEWWQLALSDVASGVVMGATLTGMLLGHWYLTTPTMSIRPLFWFAGAVVVSGLLRLLASALVLLPGGWPAAGTTHGLWLVMRLVGGVVVPIIMGIMVIRILKYRNTQSATGVLFAGLILVFMGEMAAALLERDLQLPF